MRVFAPGKLVLTGAYAVLQGAPAIVVATSRGAYADTARTALLTTPEVRAAIGEVPAPHADASSMFVGARKLGLGASSAILVASLAAREAEGGADLESPRFRQALFTRARTAHSQAQSGGSGVDVAAAVYGGTLRYVLGDPQRAALPTGTKISAFACGTSARTSELRAEVGRLETESPAAHRACMSELIAIANEAAHAIAIGDRIAFVETLRRTARGLARLGAAAHAPIVPPGFDALEALAAREEAAFSVSGAGGGDVAVYVGSGSPSSSFLERAHALGLFPLDLSIDEKGVRIAPQLAAASWAVGGVAS
jgi:phosphomevalonate kinase